MLTGIHLLLTYTCLYECDHCFLYCSPNAEGTFTIEQISEVIAEAARIGTVEWTYFEGGEPFLFYPIMAVGMRMATSMNLKTGIVTNCYWATSIEDAKFWLDPLVEIGIHDLSLSDDSFHHGETGESPAKIAAAAAQKLGVKATTITIEKPAVRKPAGGKGDPVIGGGAVFRGRAVDKLVEGLPTRPGDTFCECTREELVHPKRVHVDPFGHVHVCQGLSIGNMWESPLSEIMADYDAAAHPICGPLVKGGPAELARVYDIRLEGEFVDECHYCYLIRKALIDRFPEYLAPRQVYGLENKED